ncbi:MAG TPA: helix-turn-helix domain-containing protein [Ktedonobacterales bacterium]|jgi:AcrR family transcriptional regulator
MTDKRAKRRYDSTHRQAQSHETRQHILDTARQLFTTRGYAGTTLETLAREAGVAVETIYAIFGSKRAVLSRLIDVSVLGDDDPAPLLERPPRQQVRMEPDQRRQIRLFARDMSAIMGRVGPLWGVVRAAAPTDPELATTLRHMLSSRRNNLLAFVRWLERNGPLRVGLSTDDAADTVWAVSSAEVHHLLTVDGGWTADRYEQWLGETLIAALLPTSDTAR